MNVDTLRSELDDYLRDIGISCNDIIPGIRWDPMARSLYLAVYLNLTDSAEMDVLLRLLQFEEDHADEFTVVIDIVPFWFPGFA